MKNTFRKAALSTICMLIVAVMSLTGVTYAWFTASTQAAVNGMEVNIGTAGAGLQVATVGGEWAGEITLQSPNAAFVPVSTVDAQNFYSATVDANAPTQIVKSVKDTTNFWTQDFRMRNTGNGDITVALNAEVFGAKNGNADAWKAARIAIFQVTEVGAMTTTGGVASAATAGLKFIHGEGGTYLGLKAEGENFSMTDANNAALGEVSSFKNNYAECQFVVPGMTDANANQEATYRIVIWFEGQDSDCINDKALSSFTVDLKFEVQ